VILRFVCPAESLLGNCSAALAIQGDAMALVNDIFSICHPRHCVEFLVVVVE